MLGIDTGLRPKAWKAELADLTKNARYIIVIQPVVCYNFNGVDSDKSGFMEVMNMTEKALLWNRFIEEICYQDIEKLSEIQRMAVLCFWYDAEMSSGGYSGYMDCYPDTDAKDPAGASPARAWNRPPMSWGRSSAISR